MFDQSRSTIRKLVNTLRFYSFFFSSFGNSASNSGRVLWTAIRWQKRFWKERVLDARQACPLSREYMNDPPNFPRTSFAKTLQAISADNVQWTRVRRSPPRDGIADANKHPDRPRRLVRSYSCRVQDLLSAPRYRHRAIVDRLNLVLCRSSRATARCMGPA